jgi:hypothetical protein
MMSPSAKSCHTTGLVNVVGAEGAGVVGVGVGVVPPVQATPLRLKLAGTGLLDPAVALKPNDALPPVGRLPL